MTVDGFRRQGGPDIAGPSFSPTFSFGRQGRALSMVTGIGDLPIRTMVGGIS